MCYCRLPSHITCAAAHLRVVLCLLCGVGVDARMCHDPLASLCCLITFYFATSYHWPNITSVSSRPFPSAFRPAMTQSSQLPEVSESRTFSLLRASSSRYLPLSTPGLEQRPHTFLTNCQCADWVDLPHTRATAHKHNQALDPNLCLSVSGDRFASKYSITQRSTTAFHYLIIFSSQPTNSSSRYHVFFTI